MRKLLLLVFLALILAACGGTGAEDIVEEYPNGVGATAPVAQPTEPAEEIPPPHRFAGHESSIPLDEAAEFFALAEAAWDEDGGELWGIPLHVPLIFADVTTRHAVANTSAGGLFYRQGDVYVGILPDNVAIWNTSANFEGLSWGMMTWALAESLDDRGALQILVHEAFHAVQYRILSTQVVNMPSGLMDYLDARVLVMLETNALLAAIRAQGEERTQAITDALSFRAERRARHRGHRAAEISIEISEGLAVFTDLKLVFRDMDEILEWLEDYISQHAGSSGLRGFGYFTGALYAMLLQESGADWQNDLCTNVDLAQLLREALSIDELRPFDEIDLELYGYAEITAVETAWLAEADRIIEGAEAVLPDRLLLLLHGAYAHTNVHFEVLSITNPEAIIPVPHVVYYGNLEIYGSWGRIAFVGGYIRPIFNPLGLAVSAMDMVIDGNVVTAPTWVLTLNEGYSLLELPNGNFRAAYN